MAKIKSPSKEVTAPPSMVGSMPEMMKMSAADKKRQQDFQTEDDSRDVQRYLKIRADGPRHTRAVNYLRKQNQALDSLDGNDNDEADAMPRKASRVTARKAGRPRGR